MDGEAAHVDLTAYGHKIKDTVLQWIKLPICVGVGHSKTLAKLANKVAKKQVRFGTVFCFIQNSQFDRVPFDDDHLVTLPAPTDSTTDIATAALWMLKRIYKPGVYYQKVGIMLSGLVPAEGQQSDLFGYSAARPKSDALMETLDKINKKYGRGTTRLASEGFKNAWAMQRNFKSPNYTIDWDELPIIGKKVSKGNRATI